MECAEDSQQPPDSVEVAKANNIIIFPKTFVVPPLYEVNKPYMTSEKFVNMHVNLLTDQILEIVFQLSQDKGIPLTMDTDDQTLHNSVMLATESIKSMLLRVYEHDHPLQNVANEIFSEKPK